MDEKILAAITALGQRMDERFDKLESRMDKLESRMDKLESRMDKLESRVSALETDMKDLKSRVHLLEVGQKESYDILCAVRDAQERNTAELHALKISTVTTKAFEELRKDLHDTFASNARAFA